MLIVTILWVVLAAAVILLATLPRPAHKSLPTSACESGTAVLALAVVYGLALLVGFIYVSKFLFTSL